MMPNLSLIVATVLIIATLGGIVRLVRWYVRAPVVARAPGRLAALLGLSLAASACLYLTLFPPRLTALPGTLVVATRGAKSVEAQAGDRVVALPEAEVSGVQRVPDLATALRLYPDTTRLMIVGEGLKPRDLPATEGRSLAFAPAALPRGITGLYLPERVAPGARFEIGVSVNGVHDGVVDLLDPAGGVVDTRGVDASGQVNLSGVAKTPGPVGFTVRVREGASKQVIEAAEAPVWVDDTLSARVRLMAGAPGPEVKYLRRWAADAGVDMQAELPLGGGIEAGDAPPLTPAVLAQTDLLVIDERGWDGLGDSGRSRVVAAVRAGMGLLLRPGTSPSAVTRAQWAALGLRVSGSGEAQAAGLPSADKAKPLTVTRLDLRLEGSDAVPFMSDDKGRLVGLWRAEGRGRIGLWTVTDSFGLSLSGHGGEYGDIWSGWFSRLSRRPQGTLPQVSGTARVNERLSLCGLNAAAEWLDPDGGQARLIVDPSTGERHCAAVWPSKAGWHLLRTQDQGIVPVFVRAAEALPGGRAAEARQATLARVSDGPGRAHAQVVISAPDRRGSPWPWFAGWLVLSGLLWALERARLRPAGQS